LLIDAKAEVEFNRFVKLGGCHLLYERHRVCQRIVLFAVN
jgi:hypothetical protein